MKFYIPKKLTKADFIKSLEAIGRRKGKPIGSYIIDLADLKKTIVLCSGCVKGFDAKRHGYYRQREYPYVRGNCDACRIFSNDASLFIHQKNVAGCWVTKEGEARTKPAIR